MHAWPGPRLSTIRRTPNLFAARPPLRATWHLGTSFEGADVTHEMASPLSEAVVRPPGMEVYAFGPVHIDVARHVVLRDGQPIALAPKHLRRSPIQIVAYC